MSNGWIKLHRKLQDCWIWLDKEPFDKRSAWVDLLLTANHSDKKILFGGEIITVKRGQILTSIRKLSERWKWSYDKTSRFLKLLESDRMLRKESDNFRTLLTLENYEVYQDVPCTNRTPTSEPISEPTEHPQVYQPNTDECTDRTPISDKQECKEYKESKEYKEYKNVENIDNNNIYINNINIYKNIVEYLNLKCGTRYKFTTPKTKKQIKARLDEGFSESDFYTVIDKKSAEWLGTDMEKYLRPETLFGTKFEGYLNQSDAVKKINNPIDWDNV